jgi:hypothetical protein
MKRVDTTVDRMGTPHPQYATELSTLASGTHGRERRNSTSVIFKRFIFNVLCSSVQNGGE